MKEKEERKEEHNSFCYQTKETKRKTYWCAKKCKAFIKKENEKWVLYNTHNFKKSQ